MAIIHNNLLFVVLNIKLLCPMHINTRKSDAFCPTSMTECITGLAYNSLWISLIHNRITVGTLF